MRLIWQNLGMEISAYAGNAGDRNARGMRGAIELGAAIADQYSLTVRRVGEARGPIGGGWMEQLDAAMPNLQQLSRDTAERLENGDGGILSTMGRCAASIATLPLVARRFPEAAIVWFDAHGDCNVPFSGRANDMSYLGGMVLTGAAGEWDTGLGDGLDLGNVILVGARDLDPPEQTRIELGQIEFVSVGKALGSRLREALRGRRAYIHLDCDVMNEGLLATEYQVSGGLHWSDLREAFEVLALHDPIGLEIAECEDSWPDGEPNDMSDLLLAVRPVLAALQARQSHASQSATVLGNSGSPKGTASSD